MPVFIAHSQSRHRLSFLLLLLVCVTGLFIAALEKWRQDNVYRLWATVGLSRVLNPIMNLTNRGLMVTRQFARLRLLEQENQRLRHELAESKLLGQLTEEELRRLQRLSGLGRWSGPAELRFLTADVIGLVTNEDSAEIIINRGQANGVRVRDPAVALGGLVGLVQSIGKHTAHIQGLADPLSAVGAVAVKSRARGVVYGRGRGKPMEFIPENEAQPLEPGTMLVTSGFENSIYPKGIMIGKITSRQTNMYGMPFGAVQPVVPFEAIEEVLLVIPHHREGTKENTTESLGRYAIEMPLLPGETSSTVLTTDTTQSTTSLGVTTGTIQAVPLSGTALSSGTTLTTQSVQAPINLELTTTRSLEDQESQPVPEDEQSELKQETTDEESNP